MALDPRDWDQFLTQAVMKLTGASNAGVRANAYSVFKEFFTDSNAWTEDIVFQALAAQDTYTLAPSEEGQVIRLVGVWDSNGLFVPAFMREFSTLKLSRAPDSTPTTEWFARVVKTVTLPIDGKGLPIAPDWTLRVYSEHVLDGVLGKMMAEAGKPYSNQTLSAYHLRRFRTGIQIARTAAIRANLVGGQEWSYPRNATGGSQRGGVSTPWPTRVM